MSLVAFAAAQDFDHQIASIVLLQSKAVQKELDVSAQQRAAMNKFADSHRVKLKAYYEQLNRKGTQQANLKVDQQKLEGMFAVLKQGVLAQLSPAQVKRLREISLQALDFEALADTEVASKVGMSSAQRKSVIGIIKQGVIKASGIERNAVAQATVQLRSQKPKNDAEKQTLIKRFNEEAQAAQQSVGPQIRQIKVETRNKVLAMLSPAQRARWQELLGRPFRPG